MTFCPVCQKKSKIMRFSPKLVLIRHNFGGFSSRSEMCFEHFLAMGLLSRGLGWRKKKTDTAQPLNRYNRHKILQSPRRLITMFASAVGVTYIFLESVAGLRRRLSSDAGIRRELSGLSPLAKRVTRCPHDLGWMQSTT